MTKTFKSLSLALALAMVLTLFSAFTVSAAASLTIDNVEKDVTDGIATFVVTYTAVDVSQVTILATKGDQSGPPTESDTNIVYADQQDATAGSFTFKVKTSLFNAETPYIYIKIGGTAIDSAQKADGIKMVEDVVGILMYGDVDGSGNVTLTDASLIARYCSSLLSGLSLPETDFPDGVFKAGTLEVGNVSTDDVVSLTDASLVARYCSSLLSGISLPETDFPGGKFPAYNK